MVTVYDKPYIIYSNYFNTRVEINQFYLNEHEEQKHVLEKKNKKMNFLSKMTVFKLKSEFMFSVLILTADVNGSYKR